MRPIVQSQKLQHVRYDVRGPILVEAQRLEAEGHKILKLNIGNPAPFGFEAPEAIVPTWCTTCPTPRGTATRRGIYSARTAVAQYYQSPRPDRHRASTTSSSATASRELISMVLQAFARRRQRGARPGARLPAVDRRGPLSGGTPVHYRCDEANGWDPDLADIEAKITAEHPGPRVINPNNPTGAVYSEETRARAWSTSPGATSW